VRFPLSVLGLIIEQGKHGNNNTLKLFENGISSFKSSPDLDA
jgi:hypothetical protein